MAPTPDEARGVENLMKRLSKLAVLGNSAEPLFTGQNVAVRMIDENVPLDVFAACEGDQICGTMIENVDAGVLLMIDYATSQVSCA